MSRSVCKNKRNNSVTAQEEENESIPEVSSHSWYVLISILFWKFSFCGVKYPSTCIHCTPDHSNGLCHILTVDSHTDFLESNVCIIGKFLRINFLITGIIFTCYILLSLSSDIGRIYWQYNYGSIKSIIRL